MCGRFTDMYTWEQIYAYYQLIDDLARNWPANYNVCPTQEVGTIVLRDGRRRFERMRWGIIPWFHKKPIKEWKSATFNASIESASMLMRRVRLSRIWNCEGRTRKHSRNC